MNQPIKLGPDLSLPLDVVTQTLGLLGMRGVGKTHLLCVLCEEIVGAGQPVVILDPLGVLYGLRSSKDGKRAGLSVIVLGGEHGDVPLESTAGAVIADWVVKERRPCVLDLSGFRKAEQRRFVTDFAVRLYERNREPLHLVVDEADLFCPQRPRPDEMAMLGAFEDLVRRGRARGIGLSLATQRAAVIAKDVLTQVGALVVLRMVGPQDVAAIEEWIKYHGTKDEKAKVLASLASLPKGTAWFWSPGWLGILQRVRIRDRETFDSSSTPTVGSRRVDPQKLAPVDIEALRSQIADTIERAKEADPRELRRRIKELEKSLAERPEPETVEVVSFDQNEFNILHNHVLDVVTHAAAEAGRELDAAASEIAARLRAYAAERTGPAAQRVPEPRPFQKAFSHPAPPRRSAPPPPTNGAIHLDRCARAILSALVQHGRLSLVQAAIIAGYAPDSGGVRNAAGALRTAAYVDGGNASMEATSNGAHALGPVDPLPVGSALAEYWYAKLEKAEREILRQVVRVYPKPMTLVTAAERAGYAPDSGGVRNAAGRLRTLSLVHGGNGGMVADERLID